jgi:hypothetical protein
MIGNIGEVIQWIFGKNQDSERTPALPPLTQDQKDRFRNIYGNPTPSALWYYLEHVQEFDQQGNMNIAFMDWFRSEVLG